jgi:hypothetical protein
MSRLVQNRRPRWRRRPRLAQNRWNGDGGAKFAYDHYLIKENGNYSHRFYLCFPEAVSRLFFNRGVCAKIVENCDNIEGNMAMIHSVRRCCQGPRMELSRMEPTLSHVSRRNQSGLPFSHSSMPVSRAILARTCLNLPERRADKECLNGGQRVFNI